MRDKTDMFDPATAKKGMGFLDVGEGMGWIFTGLSEDKEYALLLSVHYPDPPESREKVSYAREWLRRLPSIDQGFYPMADADITIKNDVIIQGETYKAGRYQLFNQGTPSNPFTIWIPVT